MLVAQSQKPAPTNLQDCPGTSAQVEDHFDFGIIERTEQCRLTVWQARPCQLLESSSSNIFKQCEFQLAWLWLKKPAVDSWIYGWLISPHISFLRYKMMKKHRKKKWKQWAPHENEQNGFYCFESKHFEKCVYLFYLPYYCLVFSFQFVSRLPA